MSELKIVSSLAKLKPGKRLPSDDIDGFGLLLLAPLLFPAITHIVKLSITTSVFATVWKEQVIHPHHKKADREDINNYRPVSDSVQLGLLTEHVVHEQLVVHFNSNKLFHANHHSSLASHDTSTALIQANTFCLEAAEAKKLAATLLVDRTAAFDLVDHSILMGKLEAYGCLSNSKFWFSSYLARRSFRVQVEAARSRWVPLGPYGVPQGSVLGSTMYVISENDLPAVSPQSKDEQTIAYVDDTTDQAAADTPEDLQTKMQSRADNVSSWLADNRMIIAPSKTKLIITVTSRLRQARPSISQFSIMLGGMRIFPTPSERLLGITIREDLTWLPHFWGETWRREGNLPGLIPELLKRLGLLKYLGRMTSKHKMKSLVPGMFTSKLAYGSQLTSSILGLSHYGEHELHKLSCPKSTLYKLQTAQRQVAALLCPELHLAHDTPTSLVLQHVNILSVHQQSALAIISLALRILRTGKPQYLADRLVLCETRGRSNQLLQVPNLRLNLSHEGFTNQAARLVNMLPPEIIEASMPRQKKLVRAWVSSNILAKP